MPIARVFIPWHHCPTVPNPTICLAIHAVSYTPRFALPPPPTTTPPPPTPVHIALPTAFDPLAMLASSSSMMSDFELSCGVATPVSALKAGIVFPCSPSSPQPEAPAAAATPPPLIPRSMDIHVHSSRRKVPVDSLPLSPSPPSLPGRRSPPPSASPIQDNITLELECRKETSNRIFREREWLAYVAV
nr:vegetative cell wall protein gp1-like [Setaria viridis]